MPSALQTPQHPAAAEIHTLLRELDERLHDVLEFTRRTTFDPLEATEVMDRFGGMYHRLDRRFCHLLLELDEVNRVEQESNAPQMQAEPAGSPAGPTTA